MSDFDVVRGYLHDGDGVLFPDGVEALDRIEAELARLREFVQWTVNFYELMEKIGKLTEDERPIVEAARNALQGDQ